jgi:hypothetical protein
LRTRRALLAVLGALPGCTLIDQTTFNPEAGKRPAIPQPPPPPAPLAPETGPSPLLSIRLPASADLRPEIAKAVAAARARKPDVVFEVVEITPSAGAGVGQDAAEVARLITAQGVPAARVQIAARPVPNAPREVRVYVR